MKITVFHTKKHWRVATSRLFSLVILSAFIASSVAAALPRTALADFPCPEDMSDLDCAAIYGPWQDWVPESTLAECAEGSTTLAGNDNTEKAFNYFVSKGLTPEQSAGILGNLIQESRLNPAIVQGGGTSKSPVPGKGYGIAQWTPSSRQQALVNFASSRGAPVNTLGVQLDFIWQESTGKTPYKDYGNTISSLKKAKTAAQAALTFHKVFERSADTLSMIQERVTSAEQVLKLYGASVLPAAGSGSSTSSCNEAFDFTLGSYNILHAQNHTAKSRSVGGCNTSPSADDPTCAKARTERLAKIVSGHAANPNFDIFGTQETSSLQYRLIKQNLSGYGAFPTNPSRMNNKQDGAVSIFWDKSKFSKFDSGKAPGISNTAKNVTVPWVGLQTTSGQKLYVMSVHYAQNNCSDGNCGNGTPQNVDDANMRRSASMTIDWVRSKAGSEAPVFVVGDFNDRMSQKLSYCVYTRNGLMQHAYDSSRDASPNKECPSNARGIDHIYATPFKDMEVKGWSHVKDQGIYSQTSDHTPVWANIHFAGAGTNFGKGQGKFTDGSKKYSGVQQMLNRAKQLSKPGSTLANRVCGANCLGLCDRLAGGAWGYANSGYASAAAHWSIMKSSGHAHPNDRNPPIGALLFYETGSPAGHVAVYLGGNKVLSNDVLDSKTGKTGGAYIADAGSLETGPWQLRYLGWSDPVFRGGKL